MKQLTVISGKGGTGKTTIAAAFASLAHNAVIADCDVDAADMHLILDPDVQETVDFYGLDVAVIDPDQCTKCGVCREHCRFDAITPDITIEAHRCEGCGVCEYVCPVDAITMENRRSGWMYRSLTRFGPMVHAKLGIGEEASGKLVAVVRESARKMAEEQERDLVIIDGPPGTGCSVIAAITGVDMVLIITEPSLSGIHDLERVVDVAYHFNIPATVCINKYDINDENTRLIEEYCDDLEIPVVGRLPFDNTPTQAMINEMTVCEYSDSEFSRGVTRIWEKVLDELLQVDDQ
ncbi:MAG: 4Fe-4S binding protein [Methanosarcinaceae archaeon]|nr:4Fe-4S binding protein [Methanosarcinaceae archaeon]